MNNIMTSAPASPTYRTHTFFELVVIELLVNHVANMLHIIKTATKKFLERLGTVSKTHR
jgi:hypothetical protein